MFVKTTTFLVSKGCLKDEYQTIQRMLTFQSLSPFKVDNPPQADRVILLRYRLFCFYLFPALTLIPIPCIF